ncbi:hypothetical protein [Paludisphaera soli]|uniref:hypothetical protein n=1 Tax=Paludisphaera soli TaxID=2712865 RepID=UPI0013EBDBE8|nr:hypothetical protein [Paludisphaera soli]
MPFEAALSTTALLARRWGPTLVVAAVSAAAGVAWTNRRDASTGPESAHAMESIGRAYPKALGAVYAEAWRQGADALESGRGVNESLSLVAETWAAGRTALFDRVVARSFAAAVPEGKPDAEVSRADKVALAAIWRAFAAGLSEAE